MAGRTDNSCLAHQNTNILTLDLVLTQQCKQLIKCVGGISTKAQLCIAVQNSFVWQLRKRRKKRKSGHGRLFMDDSWLGPALNNVFSCCRSRRRGEAVISAATGVSSSLCSKWRIHKIIVINE